MSRRRSNMLEAFQASTAQAEEAEDGGGPDLFSGTRSRPFMGPGSRLPGALLVFGTLVLGFLIGRFSAPSATVAAGPGEVNEPGALPWLADRATGGSGAAEPAVSGGSAEASETGAPLPPSPEENADAGAEASAWGSTSPGNADLMATANRVTLRVIYYAEDEEDKAWLTHDYLVIQGLPVGSPVRTGRIIVLLVGAAPGAGELEGLKGRLRSLPGPNNEAGAFKGAYVVNIDSYIDR